jgi:hypothetical protein
LQNRLFEETGPAEERLRWRSDITGVPELLAVLNRRPHEAALVVETFLRSHREKENFWRDVFGRGACPSRFTAAVARKALARAHQTASIFSVHLVQDWLSLDPQYPCDPFRDRINVPGVSCDTNWRFVLPFSLERMMKSESVEEVAKLNRKFGRV